MVWFKPYCHGYGGGDYAGSFEHELNSRYVDDEGTARE